MSSEPQPTPPPGDAAPSDPPQPGAEQLSAEQSRIRAEQFRLLVETATDYAIFLLDPQGNIASWNPGAERIKGYRTDEIVGQHFSRFYTPADIARQHPEEELRIARAEGRFQEEGWRVRKDGSQFLANVTITALYDSDGVLHGFSKITRDITAQRQHEEEQLERVREQMTQGFLREILLSVTEGKLRFCAGPADLPPVAPAADPWFTFSRQSLALVRRRAYGAAVEACLSAARAQDLMTAVAEAAMNAVVHAQGARARLGIAESGAVQVWIEDRGTGIDLAKLPRATLERGFTTAGSLGHGFWLMLQTCDRLWLLTGPEGTTLVIEQDRETPEPQWLRQSG